MNRNIIKNAFNYFLNKLTCDLETHQGIVDCDGYTICKPTEAEQQEYQLVKTMLHELVIKKGQVFEDETKAELSILCGI